jgi:hypothetical protein
MRGEKRRDAFGSGCWGCLLCVLLVVVVVVHLPAHAATHSPHSTTDIEHALRQTVTECTTPLPPTQLYAVAQQYDLLIVEDDPYRLLYLPADPEETRCVR